ncbi:M16 family metallopeptidase [Sulfuriferula thiophila]|uniref:M16 family metallopeptidase n=1 Tax=Sulfuriferula thiophila TaxID=1781211 RepID=UPI000F60C340|nr:pitrilysin family protein [Sulfuriferula thiophila]
MRIWIVLLSFCITALAHAGLPIQHWQLANGAQVYFVESHDLPMLDVSVDFPAGSAFDPVAKPGLASLTHRLLDQGAGGLSDNQIASGFADVGAQLGGRLDADRAGVVLRTLSSPAEQKAALTMLARVLSQPAFAVPIVEREKMRVIAALKEAEGQPASVAARAFQSAVFINHPYAHRETGEIDSVGKLNAADLRAFYRSHYSAAGAVVALMGDITRQQADAVARQLTDALPPASAAASTTIPPVPPLSAASMRTLPFPAKQSQILIGQPGVARGAPDYYALYVGNYILGGGGFDSRLMNEVRQKRGLAYSVYSYFMPMREAGAFQIGLQTRTDQTEQALQVVRDTLADFVAKGVTEDELTQAKNNIIGGFPLRIDSNKEILEYLAVIGFYHLPLSYLDDFPQHVAEVTSAQIQAAFAQHIHPDKMVTIVVGGAVTGK